MPDITIRLIGQDQGGGDLLAELKSKTDAAAEGAEGLGGSFGKMAESFATGTVMVEAAGKAFEMLKETIGSSIDLAKEHEVVVAKLTNSMREAGDSTGVVTQQYLDLAKALQDSTGVDKDKIAAGEVLLTQMGVHQHLVPEITRMSLDYATAVGDSTTATRMLGDAIETGHLGRLARLLPMLDQHKFALADVDERTQMLSEHFVGAAAAAMETHAGHILRIQNEWKEAKEKLGDYILSGIDQLVESFKAVGVWMDQHATLIRVITGLYTVGYSEGVRWLHGIVTESDAATNSLKQLNAEQITALAAGMPEPGTKGNEAQIAAEVEKERKKREAIAAEDEKWDKLLTKYRDEYDKNQEDIDALNFDEERKISLKANEQAVKDQQNYFKELEKQDKEHHAEELTELKMALAEQKKEVDKQQQEYMKAGIDVGKAFLGGIKAAISDAKQGKSEKETIKDILKAVIPMLVEAVLMYEGVPAPVASLAGEGVTIALDQLHGGGWVRDNNGSKQNFGGLGEDTTPAMLSPGERVLSHSEIWHMGGQQAVDAAAAGGGGGGGVSVVNYISAIDAQSFSGYMRGSGGTGFAASIKYGHGEAAQVLRRAGLT